MFNKDLIVFCEFKYLRRFSLSSIANEIDLSLNVTKSYLILSFIIGENTKKITKKIIKQINSLIDNNGCHKSYNFSKQAEFINDLISLDREFNHLVFTVLFLGLIIIEEPILITILLYLFNIFIVYLLNLF